MNATMYVITSKNAHTHVYYWSTSVRAYPPSGRTRWRPLEGTPTKLAAPCNMVSEQGVPKDGWNSDFSNLGLKSMPK